MKTAVCAIARNEIDYIEEWISYQKLIGFDNIYIYDNYSDDGTTELLIDLDDKGLIKRVYWPRLENIPPQRAAYNNFLNNHSTSYDYVFICDVDEFLNLGGMKVEEFIREALAANNEMVAIAIPWLMFGSGGQIEQNDDLVTKRFTSCASKPSSQVKTLFDPKKAYNMRTHICDLLTGKYIDNSFNLAVWGKLPIELARPEKGKAVVHHYYTKSKSEWDRRRNGLKADRSSEIYKKNDAVYNKFSKFTHKNEELRKFESKLFQRMEYLRHHLKLSEIVVNNLLVVRLDSSFLVLKFESNSEELSLNVKLIFDSCEYDCIASKVDGSYVLIFKMKWNRVHLRGIGVYVIGSNSLFNISKKDRLSDMQAYKELLNIAPSATELIYHTFLWGVVSGSITGSLENIELPKDAKLAHKIRYAFGFCESNDKLCYIEQFSYTNEFTTYDAFTVLKELSGKKYPVPADGLSYFNNRTE